MVPDVPFIGNSGSPDPDRTHKHYNSLRKLNITQHTKPVFYTQYTQDARKPYLMKTSYSTGFMQMGKTALLLQHNTLNTLNTFVLCTFSGFIYSVVCECVHDFIDNHEEITKIPE